MKSFENIARLYEILSAPSHRLEREGPFLLKLLRQAPGRSVIDIACGTGMHAHFLAEHGASVTACDVSEDMIHHASTVRTHSDVTYRLVDMRLLPETLGQDRRWDMAICLGNSLCLINKADDLFKVFHGLASLLRKDALVVTQTLNYQARDAQEPVLRVEHADEANTRITAVKTLAPADNHTLLGMHFYVEQEGQVDVRSDAAVLTNWTMDELAAPALEAGFHIEAAYGTYRQAAYRPRTSRDLILLMRLERELQ